MTETPEWGSPQGHAIASRETDALSAPQAAGVETKPALPLSGLRTKFNVPLKDLIGWLDLVAAEKWSWARNMGCKYVNIRIDTRGGGSCIVAAGDDGNYAVGMKELLRQGDTQAAPVPRLSEQDVVTDETMNTERKADSAYQAGRKQDAPAVFYCENGKSLDGLEQGAMAVLANLMMKTNATSSEFMIGNEKDGKFFFTCRWEKAALQNAAK